MHHVLKIFIAAILVFQVTGCTETPVLPLGTEQVVKGEEETIKNISLLLQGHLKEQYEDERFLRDTHPKANACLHADFVIESDIDEKFQHGIFQPGATYPLWMRYSNSVEEITEDHEKDFRGLGIKLSKIDGERVAFPGDEQHTQDFLFLGHDAFFAANPEQFFDFFSAQFSGKIQTGWFLATHPRGFLNIIQGSKVYKNAFNVKWNSVTGYGLGSKVDGAYTTTVRYALATCHENGGEIPEPATPDYLGDNMAAQLKDGTACLSFFVQEQLDPLDMPIENALISWSQEESPFVKVAEIRIPQQTFDSEAQKEFCENISFNPGHSLLAHDPIGGINRARKVVMKDISDLRLRENNVERFEPTGEERFE